MCLTPSSSSRAVKCKKNGEKLCCSGYLSRVNVCNQSNEREAAGCWKRVSTSQQSLTVDILYINWGINLRCSDLSWSGFPKQLEVTVSPNHFAPFSFCWGWIMLTFWSTKKVMNSSLINDMHWQSVGEKSTSNWALNFQGLLLNYDSLALGAECLCGSSIWLLKLNEPH